MNRTRRTHRHDRLDRRTTDRDRRHRDHGDDGFSLIELLVVIVLLGILAVVIVMSVTGIKTEAADTGCATDRRQLHVAAEAYFAQNGVDQIPATGTDHDRFERTLVDDGFLRGPSEFYDLDADGITTTQGDASC